MHEYANNIQHSMTLHKEHIATVLQNHHMMRMAGLVLSSDETAIFAPLFELGSRLTCAYLLHASLFVLLRSLHL